MDTENLQYDAMFEARLPVEPEIQEALVKKCQENTWLREFGSTFIEDPFLDMDSPFSFVRFDNIRMLELFFLYGNWSFRTGAVYSNLAFINQVNGGDEWWTLRYEAATDTWQTIDSISFRHIAIHSDFEQYISSLERKIA